MSYRERIAWLQLVSMLAYVPYFVWAALNPERVTGINWMEPLKMFAIWSVVRMAILAVGYPLIRRASGADAKVPLDERDRQNQDIGTRWAYYVLMAGMIIVGGFMPFGSAGWEIVNAAIFAIVVAEVVQYGITVFRYRRQAS